MKISTYRKLLIAVQVVMMVALFNSEKWLPFIFSPDVPVIIEISPASFWCALLFVPIVLVVLERFFLYNGYKKMTKLGSTFFSGILVLAIVLPLMFFPSRTEITSQSVTKHNVSGKIAKVYEFKDATKVESSIYLTRSRTTGTNLNFSYEVFFDDGYTVIFTDIDLELDKNWGIVKEIDDIVKSNNIEKELYGEDYLDSMFDYRGIGYVGDKVRILME